MAGLAPEGSQFDARQYDAKMNELYYFLIFILLPSLLYPLFLCHGLVPLCVLTLFGQASNYSYVCLKCIWVSIG